MLNFRIITPRTRTAAHAQGAGTEGVEGHVTRWHHQRGVEEVGAAAYIATLEKEIKVLRTKLAESRDDVRHPWPLPAVSCAPSSVHRLRQAQR